MPKPRASGPPRLSSLLMPQPPSQSSSVTPGEVASQKSAEVLPTGILSPPRVTRNSEAPTVSTVKFATSCALGDDDDDDAGDVGDLEAENSKLSSPTSLSTTLLRTQRTDKQRITPWRNAKDQHGSPLSSPQSISSALSSPKHGSSTTQPSTRSYVVSRVGAFSDLTKKSAPHASTGTTFRHASPSSQASSAPRLLDDDTRRDKPDPSRSRPVRTVSAPHRKSEATAKTMPSKRTATSIVTVATDADGENLKKGDVVYRKGRKCTIVKLDYMCDPPALVVRMEDTGSEVGTEIDFISLSPP